ncbi:MAG: hypothetical protein ACI9P7_000616 [Candidatus Azotimanducaceae bacterium]|jgi:hypothetical protein
MMKKVLLCLTALLAITAVLGFAFKEPLKEMVYEQVTQDMFVEVDDDNFEPGRQGTQTGDQFPPVRVSYQGTELIALTKFAKQRGLVVMFSRSVIW